MSPAVWQIAGGPAARSYVDVFLRHGVGLIGPGDGGPWSPERYAHDFALSGFLHRFAEEAREGDIVLLRTGRSRVEAVGIIAGAYLYLEVFGDVNGWDLQHARRIRWSRLASPQDFESPVFGANPTRFSRVRNPQAVDFARRFVASPPFGWQEAPLPPLPDDAPALESPPSEIAALVAQARDLAGLYWDRARFGDHPSEGELVAHFTVPLLAALGWRPEQIGIEWRKIDVALFDRLPRAPEHCRFVIEAKRFGAGVEGALEQAMGYVAELGRPVDVVVTDGIRYRLYAAQNGYEPVAYANLARLKVPATELFDRLRRPQEGE